MSRQRLLPPSGEKTGKGKDCFRKTVNNCPLKDTDSEKEEEQASATLVGTENNRGHGYADMNRGNNDWNRWKGWICVGHQECLWQTVQASTLGAREPRSEEANEVLYYEAIRVVRDAQSEQGKWFDTRVSMDDGLRLFASGRVSETEVDRGRSRRQNRY